MWLPEKRYFIATEVFHPSTVITTTKDLHHQGCHQDVLSEFFRSDLPIMLKTLSGPPFPAPSTRPQQIMKCRHTDCGNALSVHREEKRRGTQCARNTQNMMHLLSQRERNWVHLAEIQAWKQAPTYKTICEGQILIVLCFVLYLFR